MTGITANKLIAGISTVFDATRSATVNIDKNQSFFSGSNIKKHQFNYFISNNNFDTWNDVRFLKWEITGGFQYKINQGVTLFVDELVPLNACDGLILLSSWTNGRNGPCKPLISP